MTLNKCDSDHSVLNKYCKHWIASAWVGLAALFSSCCSYDGGFVFDDNEAIINNGDVKPESPIGNLLTNDFWGKKLLSNTSHKSYRPITVLSFRWTYWLAGGLHSVPFHVTNIALHAVVSVLMLHICHELFHRPSSLNFSNKPVSPSALISALLFALHPVHSESVSGIVGRADLLCALFFTLSFHFYMWTCYKDIVDGLPFLAASMACCVASVLCKEQGITVLGVCCIYDITIAQKLVPYDLLTRTFWKFPRSKSPAHTSLRLAPFVARHCAMFVTGAAILLHRWTIMGSAPPTFTPHDNPHSFVNDTLLRFVNYNYIYSINSLLLIFPHWLCFDWSMGCVPIIQSVLDRRIVAVVSFWIIYALLIVSCVKQKMNKDDRILVFALALIVVPFLPASNAFFRVGFVVAERALYLPAAGYALVIALGAKRLRRIRCCGNLQYLVWAGVAVVISAFLLKCVKRSIEWRTEMDLFTSGEKVCPLNAKLQYNIAKVNADLGNIDLAIRKYRLAISLNDRYDQPLNNLGVLLKDRNQPIEAEHLLLKATRLTPGFAAAWMNLGITQATLKKFVEAERSYLTAISHRRKYPDCYYNLANLYMETGQHEAALNAWRVAVSLKATHLNSWNNLVIHLERMGNVSEAISAAREALTHLPGQPMLLYTLGSCLGRAGQYSEGEKVYKHLLTLEPQNADGYANLGVLYHRWGKLTEAETAYQRALQLYPDASNVRDNYDMLLKKMHQ